MNFKFITNISSRRKSYKNKVNKTTRNVAGLKLYSRFKAIIPILWFIIHICFTGYLYPATPAGTIISNIVTASYSNASGLVQATVSATNTSFSNAGMSSWKPVKITNYSTLISSTNINTVLPGQTITFSHIVSNYANITNKLTLSASNLTSYAVTFYLDTNSNGIRDPGEPAVTNITIPPRQSVSILVQETIPSIIQSTVFTDIITIKGSLQTFTNFTVKGTVDYAVILPTENKIIYVFATDGIHNAEKLDGTENLGDLDTFIYMKLLYPPVTGMVDMYYDANKDPDASGSKNTSDTKVQMTWEGNQWVGMIPADDPRVINNNEITLVFEADGKIFYRTVTPSTQSYSYVVRTYQYKEQCNLLNSILYPLDDTRSKPTILCYLDKPTHVTIEIYDLRGDKIRTLLDEQCEPGALKVIWDGKNDSGQTVGIGLYFIALQCDKCDDGKLIFKVIVVKE